MKTINKLFLSIGTIAFLAACNSANSSSKFPGFKKTASGLYYKIIAGNKSTKKPQVGDIVTLHMKYGTDDTTLFDSKQVVDSMQIRVMKPAYQGDFMEGLTMMNVGDSAVFKTSADSFFAKMARMPLPKFIKPGEELNFYIKLYKSETVAEAQKEAMAKAKKEAKIEQGEIQAYMAKNNLKATPTANGLYYIETKKGTGALAEAGDTVQVNYIGKTLDGTEFDNSYKRGKPISFILGSGMVIPGWDEGLMMMHEGGKATLIVPSSLAYGSRGKGKIKPNTVLVFNISLEKVSKGKAQPRQMMPTMRKTPKATIKVK